MFEQHWVKTVLLETETEWGPLALYLFVFSDSTLTHSSCLSPEKEIVDNQV